MYILLLHKLFEIYLKDFKLRLLIKNIAFFK